MENNFIVIEKSAKNWEEAISLCAAELHRRGLVDAQFCAACVAREKEFPTGLETEVGVAIPHTTANHVHENAICLLKLQEPVGFCRMDDPDEEAEVHFVFNLAVCDPNQQLNVLRAIMTLVQDGDYLRQCQKMSAEQLHSAVYARLYA